jgi:hypothetical protein
VTPTKSGVETITESDVPEVAAKIIEHAEAMHTRLKKRSPIHMRDPLFAEVFRHADKITMKIEKTKKGVKVEESSQDPYVVKLIQAHAEVVSKFLKDGHEEVRKNHTPPTK